MSGVEVDPRPFDLPGEGPAAALCLHGLTGTPWEVRPIGEALASAGIRAFGPALPGHNETPEALSRIPHDAWIEAARGAVATLSARHDVVFGVGMSMGGLLTLLLASEGRLGAAVSIGAPLRLSRRIEWLLPALRWLAPFPRKRGGADIRDPAARARHPSYDVMPLTAVAELLRLQRRVRGVLGHIEVPLLVAHGAWDGTANPADSQEILERAGSGEGRRLVLENSGHVVPVDHDGPLLAAAVVEFLRAQLDGPGGSFFAAAR